MRIASVDITIYYPDGEEMVNDLGNELHVPQIGETVRGVTWDSDPEDSYIETTEDLTVVDVVSELQVRPNLAGGEGLVQIVSVYTEAQGDRPTQRKQQ